MACDYSVPAHTMCREWQERVSQVAQWRDCWFHAVNTPVLIARLSVPSVINVGEHHSPPMTGS